VVCYLDLTTSASDQTGLLGSCGNQGGCRAPGASSLTVKARRRGTGLTEGFRARVSSVHPMVRPRAPPTRAGSSRRARCRIWGASQ
jgi:hypothetical protein